MRLLDLPTDILVHIANYSVDNGDAIWFSLVCRSTARALAAGQTSSKLSSVFSSLSRTQFAIERLDCARSKITSVRGASVKHALARSLDGKFCLSEAGKRALMASAPIELIDYCWSNWRRSQHGLGDVRFLGPNASAAVLASEAGRDDVLDELLSSECSVLQRQLLANGGLRCVLLPLLRTANERSATWWASSGLRMTGVESTTGDVNTVGLLVAAAINGLETQLALDLILRKILPQTALSRSLVKCAVMSQILDCTHPATGAWTWIFTSTETLQNAVDEFSDHSVLPFLWNTRRAWRNLFLLRNVENLGWMFHKLRSSPSWFAGLRPPDCLGIGTKKFASVIAAYTSAPPSACAGQAQAALCKMVMAKSIKRRTRVAIWISILDFINWERLLLEFCNSNLSRLGRLGLRPSQE